jgi:hypothetical protein
MCPRANDADTRPNRTGEDDRGRRSGLATRLGAHSSQLAEAANAGEHAKQPRSARQGAWMNPRHPWSRPMSNGADGQHIGIPEGAGPCQVVGAHGAPDCSAELAGRGGRMAQRRRPR